MFVKNSPAQVDEVKIIETLDVQPQVKVVSPETDEEIKRKQELGLKQCPTCGNWDAYRAVIEDGGQGDWCPHCKKSIPQNIEPLTDIQKANNRIRTAWITGLVFGGLLLVLSLAKGDRYDLIIAIIFFVFSCGTSTKSRISAVILGLMLLSTIIGAFAAYQGIRGTFVYQRLSKNLLDSPSVKGVNGWLLWLCITITILVPYSIANALKELLKDYLLYQYDKNILLILICTIVLYILLLIFSIYVGLRLWNVKPKAVKIAKIFLLGQFIVSLIIFIILYLIIPAGGNEKLLGELLGDTIKSLFFFIIWYIYLNNSTRVSNTYIDGTILDKPNKEPIQDMQEVQEQVRYLVKRGVIFSLLWLAGIGSLIAIVSGLKARKIIKQSSTPIQGMGGIWWCLIVGSVGVLLWFPILFLGFINNLKSP
jgi:hypothetical protein